jgi:scyllo-inositol 2-dehydrogenase (NADP+)
MDPIRLGIVGPGLIWENVHRPILEEMRERYDIVAFSATSDKSRRKVAADYPQAPFFTDYRALAQHEGIDAVVVLTPIPLNAPVATAALEAGKAVFLEKPMAHGLAQGEALVALAERVARPVFVLEQVGYRAANDTLRRLIAEGAIGQVLQYERVLHSLLDAGQHSVHGYGTTAWRIHPEFPLGTLFDGGHHQIAALARMFGAPEGVMARGRTLRPEYGAYDHVLMLFDHADGLQGVFSYSDALGGGHNYFVIRGTEGTTTVERDRALFADREGREWTVNLPDGDSHRTMWRALADSYHTGEPPAYTLEDALRDLRTLDGVHRAILSGERVSLM